MDGRNALVDLLHRSVALIISSTFFFSSSHTHILYYRHLFLTSCVYFTMSLHALVFVSFVFFFSLGVRFFPPSSKLLIPIFMYSGEERGGQGRAGVWRGEERGEEIIEQDCSEMEGRSEIRCCMMGKEIKIKRREFVDAEERGVKGEA
ncbi:hypothetical protein OCU04_000781 [Sclerotinia nivalis]|uniref:Transmembrane protein n=1 Tax=Sclerotinia nivalis TaxID=352851 RepID=A0A9X0AWU0_9HELO|nr:hypothetical protein OCU04_000781 [Sclerotinia nivalis]